MSTRRQPSRRVKTKTAESRVAESKKRQSSKDRRTRRREENKAFERRLDELTGAFTRLNYGPGSPRAAPRGWLANTIPNHSQSVFNWQKEGRPLRPFQLGVTQSKMPSPPKHVAPKKRAPKTKKNADVRFMNRVKKALRKASAKKTRGRGRGRGRGRRRRRRSSTRKH